MGFGALTWVKIIGALAIVAAVFAGYLSWRSSLIEQGYNDAAAEYGPKVKKAEASAAEWKVASGQWEEAHGKLVLEVKRMSEDLRKVDEAARAKHEADRRASQAASADAVRWRTTAEGRANRIEQLEVANEECTALRELIDAARANERLR